VKKYKLVRVTDGFFKDNREDLLTTSRVSRDLLVLRVAGGSYGLVARSAVQLSETRRPWYHGRLIFFPYSIAFSRPSGSNSGCPGLVFR
jgi:hypothetical protein